MLPEPKRKKTITVKEIENTIAMIAMIAVDVAAEVAGAVVVAAANAFSISSSFCAAKWSQTPLPIKSTTTPTHKPMSSPRFLSQNAFALSSKVAVAGGATKAQIADAPKGGGWVLVRTSTSGETKPTNGGSWTATPGKIVTTSRDLAYPGRPDCVTTLTWSDLPQTVPLGGKVPIHMEIGRASCRERV